jgi:hypothetical protein
MATVLRSATILASDLRDYGPRWRDDRGRPKTQPLMVSSAVESHVGVHGR